VAYQAIVIPVMIASPGDVTEEREIVRSVIHEWNDINAAGSKTILVPVGWDTHASPEMGGRPQELINSKVLKQCDLLVLDQAMARGPMVGGVGRGCGVSGGARSSPRAAARCHWSHCRFDHVSLRFSMWPWR